MSEAQTIPVSGRVLDTQRQPVVGAHVRLARTSAFAIADSTGAFQLKAVPVDEQEFVVTAVGFETLHHMMPLRSSDAVSLQFILRERTEILNPVEVYGVRSITGMGYLDEVHQGFVMAGKKTEVLLLDSLDANTAQNNPRQVLGRVPGANYSETESSGFPSNGIGFRGLNPVQSVETNTRQNGYNITSDLFGYPESYYLPALEAVERIEVIRGASSLQFGPQLGGVINYIMKHGGSKPLEIVTQQTGGSYGLYNSYTSAGGQSGRFNYFGYLQYQGAQGWRPNSDYRKITGFAKVEYQSGEKLKLGLEYAVLRNRIHMPGGLTDSMFVVNPRASFRSRNWLTTPWNLLTATMVWTPAPRTTVRVQSTVNLSARDLVWRNEEGGPQTPDDIDPVTNRYVNREVGRQRFRNSTTEARLLAHYGSAAHSHTLAAGIRLYHGSLKRQGGGEGTDATDFDLTLVGPAFEYDFDFSTTNVAPFVENTFRLGDRLSVTPGLRYEFIYSTIKGYNPSADETAVIRSDRSRSRHILLSGVGIQYRTGTATNLYANVAQSYRPMDYSSLVPFGSMVTVDPALRDSKGYTADLGFRGSVQRFLNFDVSAFYLGNNDRIGVVEKTDASGISYPYRTNVADSRHTGMESYVEFNPVRAWNPAARWSLSVFNSLALIRAQYVSGEFSGNDVEYAPRQINRTGVQWSVPHFSTTLVISKTARSFGDASNQISPSADAIAGLIPAYTVLDWSASAYLGNYLLKAGVNNLTDARYFTLRANEYPGPGIIPSLGRSFYFTVGAKF
ncbi:MAG: TonB-dependent receptor [Cyclobacteriaceae bacterium]|nr:TonB-dependent receptor [Cyclobacteriaceae bacterium]